MVSEHPVRNLIHALQRLGGVTERGIGFLKVAGDEDFVSYAEFVGMVRQCLAVLRDAGLMEGEEVIIRVEEPKSFLIVFWACLAGRMIPVPLSAGNQPEHKRKALRVWQQLGYPRVIGEPEGLQDDDRMYQQGGNNRFLNVDYLLSAAANSKPATFLEGGGIAYVQYSSGSTGDPKGVTLTHENLCVNVWAILNRSRTSDQDSILSWMPLTHDMGMICFHLCGIVAGINQYIIPTGLFIRRPLLWIQAAAEKKATQLYSPNFGLQFFLQAYKRALPVNWDLSGIRIIYNGAEQISAKICHEFTAALQPHGLKPNVMFPGYGLAEAAVAVALPDPGDVLTGYHIQRNSLRSGQPVIIAPKGDGQSYFVEVGYPVPDCAVRIMNAGEALPEGWLGDIEIKGGNVTAGYYRMPERTKDLFSRDGWLKTGDLGFIMNGRLVIAGRSKNMIIKNGINYFQHDLESILLQVSPLETGNFVITSCWNPASEAEEVLIFVNFKKQLSLFPTLDDRIRMHLLAETGLLVDHVLPVKKIPKTTSGKIQHYKLTESYLKGEYLPVLEALQAQISVNTPVMVANDDLEAAVEMVCRRWWTDFSWDGDFWASGLNSLQLIRVAEELKNYSGREVTVTDLYVNPDPRRLLEYLRLQGDAGQKASALVAAVPQASYPVLPSQRKMWVLETDPNRRGLFNISFTVELKGVADPRRVESSFRELSGRHESLRTHFIPEGDQLRQIIAPYPDHQDLVRWQHVEISEKEALIRKEANGFFDLEKDRLIRAIVWQDGSGKDILQITLHHIITDGWSVQIILQEFSTLYFSSGRPEDLSPVGQLQLKDYCCWYKGLENTSFFHRAAKYWSGEFRNGVPVMQLPFQRGGQQPSFRKEVLTIWLGDPIVGKADTLARGSNVSRFTLLLALLHSIFYRYNGQATIVTGIETANRGDDASSAITGPLANTLLLQSHITPDMSLTALSSQLQQRLLKGIEFESFCFDELADLFSREKIFYPRPVFNTLIIYHNYTGLFDSPLLKDARINAVPTSNALCDLVLDLMDDNNDIRIEVHYDTGLFREKEIRILMDSFRILAESLLDDPEISIGQARYLDSREEQTLLKISAGTKVQHPFSFLPDLLANAVSRWPQKTAIVYREIQLSYRELDSRVQLIADHLTRQYGVKRGAAVAVIMAVNDWTIPIMFAVWRCGAVYVPVDPDLPEQRIRFILDDSLAGWVVTEINPEILTKEGRQIIPIRQLQAPRPTGVAAAGPIYELACVLYTSGTTGYPKGIAISHDSLSDYTQTFITWFGITHEDHIIQQASIHFDTSLEEILPVLAAGGKLVIAPGGARDVHALLHLMEEEEITVLSTTPAVIREIDYINPGLKTLRLLISGGERMERRHIDHLIDRHFEIYNTYGPAETTLCATYYKIQQGEEAISIGRPISNREVFILDDLLQLRPSGETGEICIGGRGLAKYYLNQPELTRERFVPHPFDPGQLLYRSGDLGRWLPDNSLEYTGRKDNQLKIRGYRVECEEVEQVINRSGNCQSVVVPVSSASGEIHLSAYLSGMTDGDMGRLRGVLTAVLPYYMIPDHFILLEKLPISINGKLDKEQLSGMGILSGAGPDKAGTGLETATQKRLAGIWQEILETEVADGDADFLQLGGHSLRVVRLISRIDKDWRVKLSLRDIFEHTVLQSMAEYIDGLLPVQSQPLEKTPACPDYPLSQGQQRLWILDRLYPGNTAYNILVRYKLEGWPGLDRLTEVWLSIVERHESLRTVFVVSGDRPRQVILDPGPERIGLKFTDLVHVADPEALLSTYSRQEAAFSFDLMKGPLARIHVFHLRENNFVLLFNMHHIVCDGWSMEVVMKEVLSGLYVQVPIEPSPAVQYKDYVTWQEKVIGGDTGRKMKEFWKSTLIGELPVLSLPADFERPAEKSFRGSSMQFTIPDDLWAGLRHLQRQENCSMYTILLATVYSLLFKESGQADILLGTATAGRDRIEWEDQVGIFANTLPVRAVIREDQSFRQLVGSVHQYVLDTFDYREYPFDLIVEDLGVERNISRYPLFDVLVNYDDRRPHQQYMQRYGLSHLPMVQTTSKFDLTFHFEEGEKLTLGIEYAKDLYRDRTIARYYSHYEMLLRNIVPNPDLPLSGLSLLNAEEGNMMELFNNTGWWYSRERTLGALFASQADQTPDRAAVVCDGSVFTYRQINDMADQLAGYIRRTYGVKRGDRVVMLLEPSEKMLAAILGVLKAGAAYVPVSMDYPDDRIAFVIRDTEPSLVITDRVETSHLPGLHFYLPGIDWNDSKERYEPDDGSVEDPAYIIYTSGSTGDPKGVVIRHFNVINLLSWLADYLKIETPKRLLSISSYSFDISVLEYFLPWLTGGTVMLTTQKERKDTLQLIRMLDEYRPDIFQSTPSLLALLVREGWQGSDQLTIISGGETLQRELAIRLAAMSRETFNMYGPTETTIYSSIYPVTVHSPRIFIGKPVGNTRMYILDGRRRVQPVGVVGEIAISGDGLAAGYYNRPLMNEEKFIGHPFETGQRLYLTGDLGRWTPEGDIEFLGRRDTQVKISGYRIECGEIEKALAGAGVSMAVVLPLEDKVTGRYLAAYLEGFTESRLVEIKEQLLRTLPAYMMPTAWRLMDVLPLNSNGKADRKLLEKIPADRDLTGQVTGSSAQKTLAEIFKAVLKLDSIGPDDDFFRMGGHSIAALKIINTINDTFSVHWTIKDIFVHSTVNKMAAKLGVAGNEGKMSIPLAPEAMQYPLSHGQYRLWLLNNLQPGDPAYNLPAVFRLEGPFRSDLFLRAIQLLVERHEILRTTFIWADGKPWQRVLPVEETVVTGRIEDRRGLEEGTVIHEMTERESGYCFDLGRGPLLKAQIIQTGDRTHLILLNIHHIVCDGWSVGIMLAEVSAYYTSLLADPGYKPAPLSLQYKDFSVWQRSREQQVWLGNHKVFWTDYLKGASTAIDLPMDHARPRQRSGNGDQYRYVFPPELTARLRRLSKEKDVSLFMSIFLLIRTLLVRYSGQRDITLGMVVSGREHSALEQQIGFYVNTIPVRTAIDFDRSFAALLEEEKLRLLNVFQHQEYPLELIIEGSGLKIDSGRSAVFDVVVNFQPVHQQLHFSLPEVSADTLAIRSRKSKFDLTFDILEGEELEVILEYNTDIFSSACIGRMIGHLRHMAEQVCDDPLINIRSVLLPTAAERLVMVNHFNAVPAVDRGSDTIVSLFYSQAKASAHGRALVGEGTIVSYEAADAISSRMSRYLIREYGLSCGDRVAVITDHRIESILWLLAILKAGAAYVPIDDSWPTARMDFILQDTSAKLTIADRPLSPKYPIPVIRMNSTAYLSFSAEDVIQRPSTGDIAYIMYTSGSAGIPKGVPITHGNIVRLVKNQNYLVFGSGHRLLQTGSLAFDASTFEIWGMLLNGGELHLLPKEELMDSEGLKDVIEASAITTMWFTASWFNQLVEQDLALFAPLKIILVGGDRLSVAHIAKVKRSYKALRVLNGYGPTEATTFTTWHEVEDADLERDQIPIGRPIATSEVFILDKDMNLQPIGVTGEICIGGEGLSTGYWHDEALTQAKFVPHPFRKGERIYHSGDLGCWREDGAILFKGRLDNQVKIRGYRVECGEIEQALLQTGGREAIVLFQEDDHVGNGYLAAYVSGIPIEERTAFKRQLKSKLPEYMVPAVIVHLDDLPLNSSGKIDRSRLPVPESRFMDRQQQSPETDMQKLLALLWEELLGITGIGPEDHFFDLGGHSLKAMKLLGLLSDRHNLTIGFKEILANPMLKMMAAMLEREHNETTFELDRIQTLARQDHYKLSHAQRRIWTLSHLKRGTAAYNMPSATILEGRLDLSALKKAFYMVIERHEILRSLFITVDEEPRQIILKAADYPFFLEEVDLSDCPAPDTIIRDCLQKENNREFDFSKGPLFFAALFRLADEKFVFVFNIHHIINDGWSVRIFINDLLELYRGLCLGIETQLPRLPIQYKDYAAWHSDICLRAKDYWSVLFKEKIPVLDFPGDFERPKALSFAGAALCMPVSESLVQHLTRISTRHNMTLNNLFLALYGLLVARYSQQDDVVVGSLVAGRNHPDLDNLIGVFMNYLPVWLSPGRHERLSDYLRECKDRLNQAYDNQEYPFDSMVEDFVRHRDKSRNPLFDTMINFQKDLDGLVQTEGVEYAGLVIRSYPSDSNEIIHAVLDFKLDVLPLKQGIELVLTYNSELFSGSRMQSFLDHFHELLKEVADSPDNYLDRYVQPILPFYLAASFTIDPLEEYLNYWNNELGMNMKAIFAPYNQLFQQLLDPGSFLNKRGGVNGLFVRIDDWIRDQAHLSSSEQIDLLNRVYEEFVGAIAFSRQIQVKPFLTCLVPLMPDHTYAKDVALEMEKLYFDLGSFLKALPGFYLIDLRQIATLYSVDAIFDKQSDAIGHMPFAMEFYAALATFLARKVCAWKGSAYKIIALDCDNTLWRGICGEDGVSGIEIDENYSYLQEFLLEKYKQGFLIVLLSKNNEQDVFDVFDNRPEMKIKRTHIAAHRINWESKSVNLAAIASELNLGLDSCIFLDDNNLEVGLMESQCAEVLSLALPEDPADFRAFLDHIWAFDRFEVSSEDKLRNEMYRVEKLREESQAKYDRKEDFIRSLDIQVDINPLQEHDLGRAVQLMQRTNQFHLNGIRKSQSQIAAYICQENTLCWSIVVKDRFGDYGFTGLLLAAENEETFIVESFLLSCRVLGRGVEDILLSRLKDYCKQRNIYTIRALFLSTSKNQPFQEFMTRTSWVVHPLTQDQMA